MLPQACSVARRPCASAGSGCSRTGRKDASCAQYSNTAWRPAGQAVERCPRVAAQPAEERQVVRAGQHVHRVDLDDGEPLDRPAQLPGADGRTAGRGSAKPWAARAMRRARPAGSRSTSGLLTNARSCPAGATFSRRRRSGRPIGPAPSATSTGPPTLPGWTHPRSPACPGRRTCPCGRPARPTPRRSPGSRR